MAHAQPSNIPKKRSLRLRCQTAEVKSRSAKPAVYRRCWRHCFAGHCCGMVAIWRQFIGGAIQPLSVPPSSLPRCMYADSAAPAAAPVAPANTAAPETPRVRCFPHRIRRLCFRQLPNLWRYDFLRPSKPLASTGACRTRRLSPLRMPVAPMAPSPSGTRTRCTRTRCTCAR